MSGQIAGLGVASVAGKVLTTMHVASAGAARRTTPGACAGHH